MNNELDNTAENISGELLTGSAGRLVGRRQSIPDPELRGARNYLLALLETTWSEVGFNLQRIKTAADVRSTLHVWENDNSPYLVVETLLRPSDDPAIKPSGGPPTAKALRATYRARLGLIQFIQDESQRQRQLHEFLEQVRGALPQLSKDEQDRAYGEVEKQARELALAEERQVVLNNQRRELEQTLKDGYACFARAEVVRFCKSRRYRLNPLKIANALAGLPFIGWRQSVKRCSKWERDSGEVFAYQLFRTISSIVNSCEQLPELIEHAEQWLRAKRSRSHPIAELQKRWYYLRRAIEVAQKSKRNRKVLPYKITSEYIQKTVNPTPVDRLFENKEHIVP